MVPLPTPVGGVGVWGCVVYCSVMIDVKVK